MLIHDTLIEFYEITTKTAYFYRFTGENRY